MNKEELIQDGWSATQCKIGTLYFKDKRWFGRFKEDRFILYSIDNDMVPLGEVETMDDMKELMMKYDFKKINKAEQILESLKMKYKEAYGEEYINEDHN